MKEGYTFGTATLEIIILLIAAFLLGMLLCWLLRKLGLCCAGRDNDTDTGMTTEHQRMAQPSDVDALRASMRNGGGSGNTNQQAQRVSAPPRATDDQHAGKVAAGVAATAASGAAAVKLTGDTATYTAKKPAGEDSATTRTITSSTNRLADDVSDAADTAQETAKDTAQNTVDKLSNAADTAETQAQGLMGKVADAADDAADSAKDTAKGVAATVAGAAGAVGSAVSASDAKPDDLKKLEGIGPKIEQLLHGAGIKTFEQLATQERDALKAILEAGGNRFKMHEPKSWPYQAELAAKGDWERLKEYQDFLIGGREK